MSVIHDLETLKKIEEEEQDEESNTKQKTQILKHVTLHNASADPYFDPDAKSEKDAKLEKHDSLKSDDKSEIIYDNGDVKDISDERPNNNMRIEAMPKMVELQSKSPGLEMDSPSGGELAKMSPVDSEDLRDLIDIQKEKMYGKQSSGTVNTESIVGMEKSEEELNGMKSTHL